MTRANWLLVAVICFDLALNGCSDKKKSDGDGGGGSSVTARQGSPKDVLETNIRAAEKMETEALLQITPPEYQDGAKSMAGAVVKMKQLPSKISDLADAAAAKSFSKELVDQLRTQVKGLGEMMKKGATEQFAGFYENGKINWDKVKFDEKSDTATATWPDQKKPAKFKKSGGKWFKIPGEGTADEFNSKGKANAAVLDKAFSKMDEIIAKVKSGDLKEAQLESAMGEWEGLMGQMKD